MTFLDSLTSPDESRQLVLALSEEQVRVHIWTTAVLDVLYPLVYGSFFAGVALASYRRFGLFLAMPALIVIPVDVAEGVVQIYGLMGNLALLDWKAFLTPAKFALFYLAFAIALIAWITWLINWVKARF